MKLRNKKTGEIDDYEFVTLKEKGTIRLTNGKSPVEDIWEFDSLAELFKYFEDYKPKTNGRFRLVKDLPTFKAGQEFHLSPKGNLILNDGKFGICAYAKQTLEKFPNILEDWFEPIIPDGNEDVIIREPLIKDAGMREVLRLWAKVNLIPSNATTIEYHLAETLTGTETEFWDNNLHIMFYGNIAPNAVHSKIYTIDELCGEVKELSNEK